MIAVLALLLGLQDAVFQPPEQSGLQLPLMRVGCTYRDPVIRVVFVYVEYDNGRNVFRISPNKESGDAEISSSIAGVSSGASEDELRIRLRPVAPDRTDLLLKIPLVKPEQGTKLQLAKGTLTDSKGETVPCEEIPML